MPAQTVLEELTRDELTREHVQQRVDDWSKRIEDLISQVGRAPVASRMDGEARAHGYQVPRTHEEAGGAAA